MSALNVHGKTIYSYAGWTPKTQEFPMSRLERTAGKERIYRRLAATEVLVLDEISMVSSNTFARLSRLMRAARPKQEPFGGVVVLVVGDFCSSSAPVSTWGPSMDGTRV